MNILRGSGTSGLKGIEALRDNKYIRPLIETDREEIEKWKLLPVDVKKDTNQTSWFSVVCGAGRWRNSHNHSLVSAPHIIFSRRVWKK